MDIEERSVREELKSHEEKAWSPREGIPFVLACFAVILMALVSQGISINNPWF